MVYLYIALRTYMTYMCVTCAIKVKIGASISVQNMFYCIQVFDYSRYYRSILLQPEVRISGGADFRIYGLRGFSGATYSGYTETYVVNGAFRSVSYILSVYG